MDKKSALVLILVLVVIAGLVFAFVRPPEKKPPVATEGQVAFADLGVAITLPQGLDGLLMGTSSAPGIGTVVRVAIPPQQGSTAAPCELGIYYDVRKASLAQEGSLWSEEHLHAAAMVNGQVPPQAKEFESFYFVYEPAQSACSTDTNQLAIERSLRDALWIAVSTATLLPA